MTNIITEKVYLKNISIEVPHIENLPGAIHQPKIDIDIRADNQRIDSVRYESSITFTIKAISEGEIIFLVELTQAGIFQIQSTSEQEITQILKHTCPAFLFPFARKNIAVMVINAGFQPVILSHINFDTLLKSNFSCSDSTILREQEIQHEKQISEPTTSATQPEIKEDTVSITAKTPEIAAPSATVAPKTGKRLTVTITLLAIFGISGFLLNRHLLTDHERIAVQQAVKTPALSERTAKILSLSTERLAEQNHDSFTLHIASLNNTEDIPAWETAAVLRPLYIIRIPEGGYAALYGVFATKDEATTAITELPLSLQATAQVQKISAF
ncbi:MAG: protein-export chaperone SecB [Gallionella sp.]|nr:protein-export chaperone SecB [Gallionella sp.]